MFPQHILCARVIRSLALGHRLVHESREAKEFIVEGVEVARQTKKSRLVQGDEELGGPGGHGSDPGVGVALRKEKPDTRLVAVGLVNGIQEKGGDLYDDL